MSVGSKHRGEIRRDALGEDLSLDPWEEYDLSDDSWPGVEDIIGVPYDPEVVHLGDDENLDEISMIVAGALLDDEAAVLVTKRERRVVTRTDGKVWTFDVSNWNEWKPKDAEPVNGNRLALAEVGESKFAARIADRRRK